MEYLDIVLLNDAENMSNEEPIRLRFVIKRNSANIRKCQIGIAVNNAAGEEIGVNFSKEFSLPESGNIFQVYTEFENHQLAKGMYTMVFSLCLNDRIAGERTFDIVHDVISFEIKFIDINHEMLFLNWPKKCSISYKPSEVKLEAVKNAY